MCNSGRPSKVVHRASTGRAKLYSLGHNFAILETASKEQIPLAVDENCSGVLTFCLFVQKRGARLDPITDIFRTMHVTAFGQHRLEARAPWGLIQEKQAEEKFMPSANKNSPTDLAHFAMVSRGNCWLSVEGIRDPIPLRRNGG